MAATPSIGAGRRPRSPPRNDRRHRRNRRRRRSPPTRGRPRQAQPRGRRQTPRRCEAGRPGRARTGSRPRRTALGLRSPQRPRANRRAEALPRKAAGRTFTRRPPAPSGGRIRCFLRIRGTGTTPARSWMRPDAGQPGADPDRDERVEAAARRTQKSRTSAGQLSMRRSTARSSSASRNGLGKKLPGGSCASTSADAKPETRSTLGAGRQRLALRMT